MKKRIVLALGGNALQKNGEATAEAQKKVAIEVGEVVAKLASKYEIIVAHGNGPQVGNILIHEEQASTDKEPRPSTMLLPKTAKKPKSPP